MSNLIHIPPSDQHRQIIAQCGFDLNDPNKRIPVRNPQLDQIFQAIHGHTPTYLNPSAK